VTQTALATRNCDKARSPAAGNVIPMFLAAKCRPAAPILAPSPVDRDIRDFLDGKNDGDDLLHALYDHVLEEPVPERLKVLLRR